MDIYTEPDIAQVRQLLRDNDLPADDLDDGHSVLFFAWGSRPAADGIVGLEIHSNVGLLRSLAVRAAARNQGIATALVAHVESAHEGGAAAGGGGARTSKAAASQQCVVC